MKVVKDTPKIEVTAMMKFKAQMEMRKKLTKDFLKKFFGIRELVWVRFEYELQYAKQAPTRDTHMMLAYVSKITPIKNVEALFDVKPPANKTIRLIGAKIIPLGEIKKA